MICRNFLLIYFLFFTFFQQGFGQDTSIFFFTEICDNGRDDDGDGLIDEQDADCASGKEICENGIDDDLDGLIDWEDTDCFAANPSGAFKFKIQLLGQDVTDSNVWGVYVKPVRGFGGTDTTNLTATGQITIIMENTPALDSISNIQSIHGDWSNRIDVFRDDDPGSPFIEHAYFFIGLEDEGVGIPLKNYQETLLFTFQTTQACPAILTLFDNNIHPHRRDFLNMSINAGMDFIAITMEFQMG